jgi:hypothetical protein
MPEEIVLFAEQAISESHGDSSRVNRMLAMELDSRSLYMLREENDLLGHFSASRGGLNTMHIVNTHNTGSLWRRSTRQRRIRRSLWDRIGSDGIHLDKLPAKAGLDAGQQGDSDADGGIQGGDSGRCDPRGTGGYGEMNSV